MHKLNLDITRPNYILMKGDIVISGVFTNYSNALKEMYRRISWKKNLLKDEDIALQSPMPAEMTEPIKLVEISTSAITLHIEGEDSADSDGTES